MSYHKEGSSTTIGPCNARVGGNEQIPFNLAAYIYSELVSVQNTSEFVCCLACCLALVLRFECPEGAFMCHSTMSSPTSYHPLARHLARELDTKTYCFSSILEPIVP